MSPEKTKILFETFPDLFGPDEFKNDLHHLLWDSDLNVGTDGLILFMTASKNQRG
jgi:hypothetical protein